MMWRSSARITTLLLLLLAGMPQSADAQSISRPSSSSAGYAGIGSPRTTYRLARPRAQNSAATARNPQGAYGIGPQLQKELGIARQQ
jgi:hypothetical protein